MKYFGALYNSFPWAMSVAITCFRSMWLQMRVNTGYIFYGCWLVFAILFATAMKRKSIKTGPLFSVINMLIWISYALVLYGWERMQIVPASIIREGIGQRVLKFAVINQTIFGFLLIGLLIILVEYWRENGNKSHR